MPNRSSKNKRPADVNQLAASIVAEATSDSDTEAERSADEDASDAKKDPAAVSLGRRGGLKGGKARAAALSPKKRKQIAKKAAEARWGKAGKSTSN